MKMIQKLGLWQGGCANFLFGVRDHCGNTKHERRQKVFCVAKNQLLSHFRYSYSFLCTHLIL